MVSRPQRGTLASLLLVLLLAWASTVAMATSYSNVVTSTNTKGGGGILPVPGSACPLDLVLKDKSQAQRVLPGRVARVAFELDNLGASTVGEAAVTVQLPPHVIFKSAFAARFGRPIYDPTTNLVTWPRVSLKARSDIHFALQVKADASCVPAAPLTFVIRAVRLDVPQPACAVQETATVVRGLCAWEGIREGKKGVIIPDGQRRTHHAHHTHPRRRS